VPEVDTRLEQLLDPTLAATALTSGVAVETVVVSDN